MTRPWLEWQGPSSSLNLVVCQSAFWNQRLMMSALNTKNTSLQSEMITISDEILIVTYCEVYLSILIMFVNLINFFWIRKTFVSTLIYQIQQIDSLVTSICQIGCIGILLSSISNVPNVYICTTATFLNLVSFFHFLLSNLFIVSGR